VDDLSTRRARRKRRRTDIANKIAERSGNRLVAISGRHPKRRRPGKLSPDTPRLVGAGGRRFPTNVLADR